MSHADNRPLPPTTRIVDIASHAQRAEEPFVRFKQVEAAGSSPPPAPAFLFGAMDATTARAIYGQIDTPEAGCYAIEDAAVAPTGIALRNGVAFFGAQLNLPSGHVATITNRLNSADLPARFVPGPLVPLFGPAEEDYRHLLIDYLPRLWLLEQAGWPITNLCFLLPATLPARAEEIVAQLGLRAEQIVRYAHWEELIRTNLLVLPTTLRISERLSSGFGNATYYWVQCVRNSLGASEPVLRDRVFVASTEAANPAESIARQAGFQIIRPDEMNLAARMAAFSAASRIVGLDDTRLYDCMFCAPGAKLCVLNQAGRRNGFLLAAVARAARMNIGYVFGDARTDVSRGLDNLGL